jgi:hypothetical protein
MALTRLLPLALLASPALADPIQIDLNALHPRDGACQMVLVAQNLGPDLTQLVLEAVLFDPEGAVSAITLLDLQDLPGGRTRVRPFEIDGLECSTLARVLINGVATCTPAEAPGCATGPVMTSRLAVEVLQ